MNIERVLRLQEMPRNVLRVLLPETITEIELSEPFEIYGSRWIVTSATCDPSSGALRTWYLNIQQVST